METRRLDALLFEPSEWFVVFNPRTSRRWLALITLGRFKHVSAFAYCPGFRAWLIYDVHLSGTCLALMGHEAAKGWLIEYTRDCEVVKVTRRADDRTRIAHRLFLYCGPAIRHLLGLEGWSILPDHIHAACMKQGGVRVF